MPGLAKGYARYVYGAISAFYPARLVAGILGSVDIEDISSVLKPNGIYVTMRRCQGRVNSVFWAPRGTTNHHSYGGYSQEGSWLM
jgi:hypothetical protein